MIYFQSVTGIAGFLLYLDHWTNMPTRIEVTTKMVQYYSNNADVEHNNHV